MIDQAGYVRSGLAFEEAARQTTDRPRPLAGGRAGETTRPADKGGQRAPASAGAERAAGDGKGRAAGDGKGRAALRDTLAAARVLGGASKVVGDVLGGIASLLESLFAGPQPDREQGEKPPPPREPSPADIAAEQAAESVTADQAEKDKLRHELLRKLSKEFPGESTEQQIGLDQGIHRDRRGE